MSSKTATYWGPRQVAAPGFIPISPLTDAAIEGIADELLASRQLFRVAQPSISPYWNQVYNTWRAGTGSLSTALNCYVGATVNGASSHGTNRTTWIGAGVKAAVYVTELELPNGSTYMPAGAWKVRLHFISDNAVCSLTGAHLILVDSFTQASATWWGTDGSASTVIHTYTPARPAVLNSSGTKTLSFSTSAGVTVPTGSKIAVLCFVTNASATTSTFVYRHNRNILTPYEETTTISMDPAGVGLSAVPATSVSVPTPTTISQGPAAIALAAVPATAVDVPLPVNISQGPAAVALSALGASSIARTMIVAAPASVALAPQAPTVSLVLSVSAQAAAIAVAGVAPTRIDREVRSSPAAVALAAVPATSVIVPAATNISQGPAAVALAAVSATAVDVPAATSISQGPAAIALAAVPATSVDVPNAINISSSPVAVAFQVQGGAVSTDSTVVIAAPATVALAALAISELLAPLPSERAAVRVVSSTVRKYLTATAHTAAKRSQCASIGGAIVRSPSVKPTPPRSPRSRGRTIASVTERSEVARSRTVPIPARTATSRFFVAASGEARQRLAGGEAMAAISNRDGPSLTNSSGVL